MNCADIGLLRAYLDDELAPAERTALAAHLADCDACRRSLAGVADQAEAVRRIVGALAPGVEEMVPPAMALRAWRERADTHRTFGQRFQGGLSAMRESLFGRKRQVAVAAVAALVLAFSVAFTPVGSALGQMLSVFRAEKFAAVTIDPTVANKATPSKFDPKDFGTFEVKNEPQMTKVASPADAKMDFAVRTPSALPSGLNQQPEVQVSTPGEVVFRFDLAKSKAALAAVGVQTSLPASLDGAVARAYVPAGIALAYVGTEGKGTGLVLLEGHSPTLEIPAALDTPGMRELFFSLSGLPPELVSQLEQISKTGDTAPVPVLKGDSSRQVGVDGTTGLLVSHRPAVAGSDAPEGSYVLWQKNGVLYILGGTLPPDQLVQAANSLR
ncbi:MAG: anti-sigma factor family protein [Chloroflexota bacterium]